MKFFLSILLSFSCLSSVWSQVFFPAPTHNPVWELQERTTDAVVLKSITTRDSFIFDEKWFYKIDEKTTVNGSEVESRALGYYRVEGSKVFVRKRLDDVSLEYLQYDFSLQTGDSVLIKGLENFPEDEILYRVLDRDTIDCWGRNLIRLTVRFESPFALFGPYTSRWVETIGDIYHPFLGFDCFSGACESSYFRQKYISVFDSLSIEDYRECQVVSSVAVDELVEPILLYPNPFNTAIQNSLKIVLPNNAGRDLKKIEILDANGKLVRSFDQFILRGVLQELKVDFKAGELSPGIYLVRVYATDGIYKTLKCVVVK